jgi:hypothetical protein
MNKKLLVSAFVCFSILFTSLFAGETGTEQEQKELIERKTVEEWQTNPEAFATLFLGDDLSERSPDWVKSFEDRKESVIEKVEGSYVEWPMTFGISPVWVSTAEESRRNSGLDNLGIYHIFGPDFSGWISLGEGSRQEGTEQITWEQMTWGIPPQSSVLLKMKIENLIAHIFPGQVPVIAIMRASEVEIETSSEECAWPEYDSEIDWSPFYPEHSMLSTNSYEVRVISAHEFPVKVGLRSEGQGRDFIVPREGAASVRVPRGKYHVYFQYAADPTSLYQGDSLDVRDSGFEIQLKSEAAGDYRILKIE